MEKNKKNTDTEGKRHEGPAPLRVSIMEHLLAKAGLTGDDDKKLVVLPSQSDEIERVSDRVVKRKAS